MSRSPQGCRKHDEPCWLGQMTATTRTLDDGTIEIMVSQDGLVELGWVSSMHLTHTKIAQLQAAIQRKSAAAFLDTIHARDISEE